MKKVSMFAAIFAAGAVFAASGEFNEVSPDGNAVCRYRPAGFDLAYPVGLFTGNALNNLSLNVFYGQKACVEGLDLGLVSRVTGDMTGLQIQGGVGWVEGETAGIAVSGLSNVCLDKSAGIAVSSILNYTKSEFDGLQIAAVNVNGEFYGAQIGVCNHVSGESAGLQIGVSNGDINEYAGCSIGVVNCAERVSGLQLGVVNYAAEKASGLQLGVFNAAKNLGGVQIGLLNLVSTGTIPVFPVLNAQF